MCTVMLRFDRSARWPIVLAAVRDEFVGRPWDPPAAHWPDHPSVFGGRDRVAGGTWMAVDAESASVAALLNGVRRPAPADGAARPTRGRLALAALAGTDGPVPGIADDEALADYDGFHLLRADRESIALWSWDGERLDRRSLAPGDHIIVNLGPDRDEDPLVPHFRPMLAGVPAPGVLDADDTEVAWDGWVDLLRGDGLDPSDERGLIIAHTFDGGEYGSTSASLVALGADGRVRYDFTGTPRDPAWLRVNV